MEHHTTDHQRDRQSHGDSKHSWLMVIGCSLPIVAVLLLPMFGVSWGTALLFLFVLACPLMHLFGMHGGHGGHGDGQPTTRGSRSETERHH